MRKRWGIGLIVVVVVAIAAAVGSARWGDRKGDGPAHNQAGKAGKGAKPEVTLEFAPREVATPTLTPLPATITFSGPLIAPQTAIVRSKAAGTLRALDVAEGTRVKAGQVLGTLDLAELESRLAERAAMVASAQAQVAQAERTHASNQRLADQQFISANALEASRSALETARAQASAAQAQFNTLGVARRDAALVAPIGGVVAKRHVVPGEKLAAEQPVLTIVDLSRLELAASVGTHEVALLQAGMPVQVQVEGVAQPVAARIARIAPAAEAGTRAIGVAIGIHNPSETFRAGQYALAQVVLADPTPRLTVPEAALGSTAGQPHLWVIENGALARRAVITGRRDAASGRVEILQGIGPDAQVLAAKFDNLREGQKAVVAASGGKAAAVAAAAPASSATVAK
jgi:membrane fusion protein (multidrug efflux system)